jgi:hypothetical protein
MTKTATLLRDNLPDFRGHASLYRLDPPLGEQEYVIVSAVTLSLSAMLVYLGLPTIETYVFAADAEGTLQGWTELDGSMKGTLSHAEALGSEGYEVINP